MPILEKKGIPAAFFVIPQTLTEKKVCNVHKIHKLRAAFEPVEFRKKVDASLSLLFGSSIASLLAGREQEPVRKYRYDNKEQAELKYVLNNVLSEEQKDRLVGVLFSEHFGDETKMANEIYINLAQAKNLFQKGSLGLHSYGHLSLANLDRKNLEKEVVAGKAVLEDLVGGEVEAISYPYGSVYDINTEVVEVCKQAGLKIGLTMERAFNISLNEPLLFARIDTNDAPGGKSPLFEYGAGGSINILGNMGQKRTLFFKE
jgi:peptidoglycan/xylan/chitin deacetylase (PgdA/CDA1 family)